jgi:hypothetical protein
MLGGVGIVLVLALGSTVSAASRGGLTIAVVEHADTDIVIDLGAPGDSLGDMLPFGNPIFDANDRHQIGRDEGICFRTVIDGELAAWECTWTLLLADGSITVQGPFLDSLEDSSLAITGGTGRFRNARGEMTLHARDELGTSFDFIYHVIG